jgi:hypothetical protein
MCCGARRTRHTCGRSRVAAGQTALATHDLGERRSVRGMFNIVQVSLIHKYLFEKLVSEHKHVLE